MLDQLREKANVLQGTVRQVAIQAEVWRLREAIAQTEQALAAQKRRLALLTAPAQKAGGPLSNPIADEVTQIVNRVLEVKAAQPKRPASAPVQAPSHASPARRAAAAEPEIVTPEVIWDALEPGGAAQQGPPKPAAQAGPPPAVASKPAPEPRPAAAPAHVAAEEPPPPAEEGYEGAEAAPAASAAEPAPHDALEAEEGELVEAIETGRRGLAALDRCITLVQELAHAGTWHIVKGIVSSRSPEHAKIDEARRTAHEARELLMSFEQQVHAIRGRLGDKIKTPELKGFTERFAGALAGGPHDEAVGERSLAAAHEAYHDVRRVCARLHLEALAVRARRAAEERIRRRAGRGA